METQVPDSDIMSIYTQFMIMSTDDDFITKVKLKVKLEPEKVVPLMCHFLQITYLLLAQT